MFSLKAILDAHAKVKSGADFPAYINELKQLGVEYYDTAVSDGKTNYFGINEYSIATEAQYLALSVAPKSNASQFKEFLLLHQQGKSDYPTFCKQAADCGVEKWRVDLKGMSCTYFNKEGQAILSEAIPA
jgi:uncharacterized protein YbcV (DUF1398 family)